MNVLCLSRSLSHARRSFAGLVARPNKRCQRSETKMALEGGERGSANYETLNQPAAGVGEGAKRSQAQAGNRLCATRKDARALRWNRHSRL